MSTQPFMDPLGIAGGILAKEAYAHAISVLIGCVDDPYGDEVPDLHIASGGVIEFAGATCVVTCFHIVKSFWTLHEKNSAYKFQIGSFACEPRGLMRDYDEGLDLAILDVSKVHYERLNNRNDTKLQSLRPTRWPNDRVKAEEVVVLCGFLSAPERSTRMKRRYDRSLILLSSTF